MRRLWRSFGSAFTGLAQVAVSEGNMRIHLAAAAGAILASALLRVSATQWCLVLIAIALVLSAECLNTALERVADRVTDAEDPLIKQGKDAAAAGVLVSALVAAAIGCFIFLPRVLELIWK